MKFKLYRYDWESGKDTEVGEAETGRIARSLTTEILYKILDTYLNGGGKQMREGIELGKQFLRTHPTLMRQAICWALGIIIGLAEHDRFLDDRNKVAIGTAKKIKALYDAGELPMGAYL